MEMLRIATKFVGFIEQQHCPFLVSQKWNKIFHLRQKERCNIPWGQCMAERFGFSGGHH